MKNTYNKLARSRKKKSRILDLDVLKIKRISKLLLQSKISKKDGIGMFEVFQ